MAGPPGLGPKPPAKAPPKKAAPKKPAAKKQTPNPRAGMAKADAKKKGGGIDWGDVVRRAAEPPADLWEAVRPYTPAPTVERAVKKATPAPARALTKAAEALDKGTSAAIQAGAAIPKTLFTPPRPGARTPVTDIKAIPTTELAQKIQVPSKPKIGTAMLAPAYKSYFAGQQQVDADEISQAMRYFEAGVRKAPSPFTDAQLTRLLTAAEKNGHNLKDAKHWTFDDLISKATQKHEHTIGGFARNTAAGFVQLSALPSGLVAGAAAGVAALGGNTKPAEEFGRQFYDFTKNSLPLVADRPFPEVLYNNAPAVAANLIPAAKGASALAGRALLRGGERSIRLPATGMQERVNVPADLLKRGAFEARKGLIESGRAPKLEAKAEKRTLLREHALEELYRDAQMMPVQKQLGDAARKTVGREGGVPFAGRVTGGQKRAAQIVESTRAGMTPEDLTAFRAREAKQFRDRQAQREAAAEVMQREAHRHEQEGEPEMAAALRAEAQRARGEAEQARMNAENNEAHGKLMGSAAPIAADHPLAQATERASTYISDVKQELGALKPDARRFGDVETKLRAAASEAEDMQLNRAARNGNPDTAAMVAAQARLRRATEARQVLADRQEAYDASQVAKQRARTEDFAGRSHAERQALGGEIEVNRHSLREIGHIQRESRQLNEAGKLHDERVPPQIGESPYTPQPGVSASESAKIKADLDNIAELHINTERNRRKGIRNRIGTLRHQLSDSELPPERRARYEQEIKTLTGKLNTPSPRVMVRIQREVDAYLKRFGARITERERRRYQAKYLVKTATVRQATGDLTALSKRERKLETRQVHAQANSSRTWKGRAEAANAKYAEGLANWERHYGSGSHATLRQAPVDRGGLRGFTNRTARGVLPRKRKLKIHRSEGLQIERAAYSPERTINGIFHEIRTISDHAASQRFRENLLRTDLVRPAAGLEGMPVPPGWHWVSNENLQKFTTHPLHASSADEVAALAAAPDALGKGVWAQLEKDVRETKAQIHPSIPDEPGVLIRQSALDALEEVVIKHDAGDFGLLLQITNEYRKALLFLLPRTFVNNMIGNVGLALLSGAGMTDIIRAAHLLRNHPEVIPSLIRNRGLIASQFGPDHISGGWMDFWRRANTFAEDLGQAATYVSQLRGYGKEKGLKLYGRDGLLKGMDDISSDWHRVALDLAHGRDPNVIGLMKKSKQFFGDVAKQTRVNKALATAVLFHRWLGHIIRLVTITLPVHYPGRFLILQRISQIGDDYRKQHGVLPDWAQGVVKLTMDELPTPKGVQEVVTGLSTTGMNPAQSLSQVADLGSDSNPIFPGQAIISGALSPTLSVPLGYATGRDLGTMRTFKDRYGNDIRPFSLPNAGHLLWQNAPVLNTLLSTANTSGDSTPWDQAPSAASPAAYRRQQAAPWLIHASSPKNWWATALRGVGVPVTRLDSYGPRYSQHLESLAFALAKQQKDKLNEQLGKSAPPAAPESSAPAAPPEKPLSAAERKKAQQDYAKKLRSQTKGSGAAAARKAQQEYARKVRAGNG